MLRTYILDYLGEHMFSDFVNFRDVDLLVNDNLSKYNFGLVSLDITHDNEIYQIFLAALTQGAEILNLTEYLNQQVSSNNNICIRVNYELKKTNSQIVDLYRLIPEKNKWLTLCKQKDYDIFVLKCRLISRNNIDFDYEIPKVANF